jgi:hypothetical protein
LCKSNFNKLLSQAGFAAPGTASLQLIWQAKDPQAILELIYKGVVRTPMVLRAQTDEARARIHEAIISGAEHYRTQGVIHLRFPAALATAVAA